MMPLWVRVCIVDLQPRLKRFGPVGGGCIRLSIRPFAQAGLDEAFGFTVGARGVGPGSFMTDSLFCQQVTEGEALSVMIRSTLTPKRLNQASARRVKAPTLSAFSLPRISL